MKKQTNHLRRVKGLLADERFEEGRKILVSMLADSAESFSPSEISECHFLLAKCYYRLGNVPKASGEIEEAVSTADSLSDFSTFADIRFFRGLIRTDQGNLTEAVEDFNDAYVYYKREKNAKDVSLALSQLARIYFIQGKLDLSLEYLLRSLDFCRENGLLNQIPVILNNVCKVSLIRGDYCRLHEAISELEKQDLHPDRRIHVLLEKATSYLHALQLEDAEAVLDQADSLTVSITRKINTLAVNQLRGILEALRQNHSKAGELYREIIEDDSATAPAVAQTLRLLVDLRVDEGRLSDAKELADRADSAIAKAGDKVEAAALSRSLGRLHALNGDTSEAREHLNMALNLFRKIGAAFELAFTHQVCAEVVAFDFAKRKRHLENARQMFEDMGLLNRSAEVEKASAGLAAQLAPFSASGELDGSASVVAEDDRMIRLLRFASYVAETDSSVLVTGETGTGKDLIARLIHLKSGREGQFVAINAAAIPNDMIESELFGYRKGAYTGAAYDRQGLIEQADGGTFYLNEIADATPEFQAKLLEVLDTHEIRRLGENSRRSVEFRIVAATNKDLNKRMADGLFRVDLYHRLNEISLTIPPLRDRPKDISALTKFFIEAFRRGVPLNGDMRYVSRLSGMLSQRGWPGNVRELKAELKRLWIESRGDLERMLVLANSRSPQTPREQLLEILQETGWNRRAAARRLGVSETTVRNRIKKYSLVLQSPG